MMSMILVFGQNKNVFVLFGPCIICAQNMCISIFPLYIKMKSLINSSISYCELIDGKCYCCYRALYNAA